LAHESEAWTNRQKMTRSCQPAADIGIAHCTLWV